jgi:pimeloyl-ACP methyl ester carboxylesterase
VTHEADMTSLRTAVFALLLLAARSSADSAPVVKDIAYAGGSERALLLMPAQPAKAAVVLFPGGDGVIGLGEDGTISANGNFLVRSRKHWVERGYAVVLPDVPDGESDLKGERLGAGYAAAVAALVDYAKQQTHARVWLIGTSQGTNAVANAASRMTHGEIAGIVLTSTLTEEGNRPDLRETVFGANLAAIDVPTLIVSHTDDACNLSPPSDGARLKAALTGAPAVDIITLSGGKPPISGPCEAKAPHGFYGVEIEAITDIDAWIAKH